MHRSLIPILVIAMVASMLVPLPSFVIDLLLTANLVSTIILLLATFFITEPLKLSAFPSLLLLMALARLSLNIATTRMILSKGEAGSAIEAFGSIVISENLIVGFVTFSIITLVQLIVVAKGAERVAEVSARFALDALPGKQMSIDADLRTGLISIDDARKRRDELQAESRLYGALDGAMKFIKGDAVAGLLITLVNIIGGIITGVCVRGLSFSDAIDAYILLSVGDGLLSQIPALLNALAAGIIVTRVVNGTDSSLALDLPKQLGSLSFAAPVATFLSLILSLLVGPISIFVAVAACVLAIIQARKRIKDKHRSAKNHRKDDFHRLVRRLPPVISIELLNLNDLSPEIINEAMESVRSEFWHQTGLCFDLPIVKFSGIVDNSRSCMRIFIHGEQVFQSEIDNRINHADGLLKLISDYVRTTMVNVLPDLITDSVVRRYIETCEREGCELGSSIIPNVISITQVTELIRSLVSERVPLRSGRLFLQALAESVPRCGSGRMLVEEIRIALRRSVLAPFGIPGSIISCRALPPLADYLISKAERAQSAEDAELHLAIAEACSNWDLDLPIIVGRGARKRVRETLLMRKIDVPVLAYEEVCDYELDIVQLVDIPEHLFGLPQISNSSSKNIQDQTV